MESYNLLEKIGFVVVPILRFEKQFGYLVKT